MGTSTSYAGPTNGNWPAAKRLATLFAKQGGTGGGSVTPAQVVAGYVGAHGGASGAANQAVAGRVAGQGLGGFLSAYAGQGLAGALEGLGLASLVGQDAITVMLGLADALAGPGRTLEEADARAALLQVLQQELGDEGLLDPATAASGTRLNAEAVQRILEVFFTEYIYTRMLQELGERIDNGALNSATARRVEQDLHAHIEAKVHFELGSFDPIAFDWTGAEAQGVVYELMRSAHEHILLSAVTEV